MQRETEKTVVLGSISMILMSGILVIDGIEVAFNIVFFAAIATMCLGGIVMATKYAFQKEEN